MLIESLSHGSNPVRAINFLTFFFKFFFKVFCKLMLRFVLVLRLVLRLEKVKVNFSVGLWVAFAELHPNAV